MNHIGNNIKLVLAAKNFQLFLDFLLHRGYSVMPLDDYGLVYEIKNDDFRRFICATEFNSAECSKILKDKVFTYLALKQLGINIPKGTYFVLGDHEFSNSIEEIINHLKNGEYPIIIKPNDSSLGKGITILRKFDERKLNKAILKAAELSGVIIAQEYLSGQEYRVVAVEGEVIFILKKFGSPLKPEEIPCSSCHDFDNIVSTSMKHLGAVLCGFDFMVEGDSIKVLEMNGNPFIVPIKNYLSVATLERYFLKLEHLLRRNYGY